MRKRPLFLVLTFNETALKNIGLRVCAARKIPSQSDIWLLSGAIWHAIRDWLTACQEIALLVLLRNWNINVVECMRVADSDRTSRRLIAKV